MDEKRSALFVKPKAAVGTGFDSTDDLPAERPPAASDLSPRNSLANQGKPSDNRTKSADD